MLFMKWNFKPPRALPSHGETRKRIEAGRREGARVENMSKIKMGFRINFWFGFVLLVGWAGHGSIWNFRGADRLSLSLYLVFRFNPCLCCAVLCSVRCMGLLYVVFVWTTVFEIEERSGAFPSKPSLFFAFHTQIHAAQPQNLKMCSLAWWCHIRYVRTGGVRSNAFASYPPPPSIHAIFIHPHKLHTQSSKSAIHRTHDTYTQMKNTHVNEWHLAGGCVPSTHTHHTHTPLVHIYRLLWIRWHRNCMVNSYYIQHRIIRIFIVRDPRGYDKK